MELKTAQRKWDELHKELQYHDGTFTHWTASRTDATPYHYSDGVHLYVAPFDVNPDDRFLNPPLGMSEIDIP